MQKRIVLLLASLMALTLTVVAQDDFTAINTLLDQAETALHDDDLVTAQALLTGASTLITTELQDACETLSAAKSLLDQAAASETAETAAPLLTSARVLIDGCTGAEGQTESSSEVQLTVVGHSWERERQIEIQRPVKEEAWCDSMPANATDVSRSDKVRGIQRVADGEECTTVRVETGEGTFREETVCETVYRDQEVYDTYCTYTVEKWVVDRSVYARGEGLDEAPTWPEMDAIETEEDYPEREGERLEAYTVHLEAAETGESFSCNTTQASWESDFPLDSLWLLTGDLNLSDCSLLQAVVTPIPPPQLITPDDYNTQFIDTAAEHILVDVRTPQEFATGTIEGAVNIPVDELNTRLDELPADVPVVVFCRSGNRSARAVTILDEAGYGPLYDLGGIIQWQAAGYPVVVE